MENHEFANYAGELKPNSLRSLIRDMLRSRPGSFVWLRTEDLALLFHPNVDELSKAPFAMEVHKALIQTSREPEKQREANEKLLMGWLHLDELSRQ